MIHDVLISKLNRIDVLGGDVLQFLKNDDIGYKKFGEIYCSYIDYNFIKGWKKHRLVTLNISVPVGKIKFVIFDERAGSISFGKFHEIILDKNNFCRITIPPLLWVAFQGLEQKSSMLLNVIDYKHNQKEAENCDINTFSYNWSK